MFVFFFTSFHFYQPKPRNLKPKTNQNNLFGEASFSEIKHLLPTQIHPNSPKKNVKKGLTKNKKHSPPQKNVKNNIIFEKKKHISSSPRLNPRSRAPSSPWASLHAPPPSAPSAPAPSAAPETAASGRYAVKRSE